MISAQRISEMNFIETLDADMLRFVTRIRQDIYHTETLIRELLTEYPETRGWTHSEIAILLGRRRETISRYIKKVKKEMV